MEFELQKQTSAAAALEHYNLKATDTWRKIATCQKKLPNNNSLKIEQPNICPQNRKADRRYL